MAVNDSIFGSKSEERGFRSIEHTWGEQYMLCPQIPFSALFTPEQGWRGTSHLFFKTSVDYVLCTQEGRPLIAIDFDGMGQGFDRGGVYVQAEPTKDPNRKVKFDYKLRYARQNDFPYHVVASEEFKSLGDGVELTVVDAIIGKIIARNHFLGQASSVLEEHSEEIDGQPNYYKSEYVGYLLSDFEVECEFRHSPIWRKKFEILDQLRDIHGWRNAFPNTQFFSELECPKVTWGDTEGLQNRIEAEKHIEFWGCVATYPNTPIGEVSDVVKVRNVGHDAMMVAKEIAELMVMCKVLRLL